MKKKRMLVLPGFFLPHNDTITQISYRILCNLDYEIDVLTFLPSVDNFFAKITKADKKIKKFNFYYLNYKWKDLEITPNNCNIFKIKKIIREYIKKSIELALENEYDYVFSFSAPNYTHYAAYMVKKRLNYKITWFASFSDPIKNNIYIDNFKTEGIKRKFLYVLLKTVHYKGKYEDVALKYSDKLIFISESLKKNITNNKKEYLDKSIIYPITFVKEWINENNYLPKNIIKGDDKIILAHFGNIYGLRKIIKFIDAINLLSVERKDLYSKIEIHQYGEVDREQKLYIEKNCSKFVIHRRINYNECLEIMRTVDILLIFDTIVEDNNDQPFLPSKIIDYLLMNKPIFAITSQCSPVYDIINNDHVCVSYDVGEIKRGIIKQLLNYDKPIKNNIKQYDNDYVSKKILGKYFDIINIDENRR